MSALWVVRLRRIPISEAIIQKIYTKYGDTLPEYVLTALEEDDRLCGNWGVTTGAKDPLRPACENHDVEMLLSRLGYPVSGIATTNLDFVVAALTIGAIGLGAAALSPIYATIGGTVGSVLMIKRALFPEKAP